MCIFRSALEELARRPAAETAASLDGIMDAALHRVGGPFETYEDSLAVFARANAALLVEEGRCTAPGQAACGDRYYDPQRMYTVPAWEEMLYYQGSMLHYVGSVPASYGTDLIQVSLDADLEGASLAIDFQSAGARFHVEVWKLHMDDAGPSDPRRGLTGLHAVTPRPEVLTGDCDTEYTYTIPRVDPAQADRLALIVVRLDPDEDREPLGTYQLTVSAAE